MDNAIYPTPTNPVILRYKGHIPALKNNRVPVVKKGKLSFQKNAEVQRFMDDVLRSVRDQWEQHPFSRVLPPHRIIAWVQIVFYRAGNALPLSDGDNAYTTLQESWQGENSNRPIGNDKQVGAAWWQVDFTAIKKLEHATAFLFVRKEDEHPFEQTIEFFRWYQAEFAKTQAWTAATQSDLEVPSLLEDLFKG